MTAHDHPRLTALDEKGRPVTILGRQMELDSEKKTVEINQNVQILHPDGRAEAQKALFLAGEDKVILEEDPVVTTPQGVLSGRRITTNLGEERSLFVEGMADAVFNPEDGPASSAADAAKGRRGTGAGPVAKPAPLGHNGRSPTPVSPTPGGALP
jgi:lipopolysaccharide export system protein LptA